jgi:hypothetical protein
MFLQHVTLKTAITSISVTAQMRQNCRLTVDSTLRQTRAKLGIDLQISDGG